MQLNMKIIVLALCLVVGVAEASIEDFRALYKQNHQIFDKQMAAEIQKKIGTASPEVQEIYRAIGYRPVWVDLDSMSHYAEMLQHELRDDFNHSAMMELKVPYERLAKKEEKLFASPSLSQRVALELEMMQLYVDHIHAILKGSKSDLTPLVLLKGSLQEGSLVHSFNAVSKERIARRTPVIEENETILGRDIALDAKLTASLKKGNESDRMKAMYRLLKFRPVWINEKGLSPFTRELFSRIESDRIFDHSGPTYQKFKQLKSLPTPTDKKEIVAREFEIAKLYQDYMGYLLYGAIDWKRFERELRKKYKHGAWKVHEVLLSPELLLIESVQKGTLKHAFEKAKPKFPGHDQIVEALRKYRKIAEAGGWPELPKFRDLKPGMRDPVIPLIRERLAIEGDYVPCDDSNGTTLYDDCLLKAVKKFQTRHGLLAEGYIGKKTRHALAETAMHKAARLRLSIARLKWLKRDMDRYHVVVNIPDYMVTVYDGWKPVQKMRVVTGRKGHETPIFYNNVRLIVLNPYWRIPPSIVRHETIPKLQKNPGYAAKNHIEIHKDWSEHSPEINPYKVDWYKYGKRLPPWHFMQSPGEKNALGKIKFLFPNSYSVYMHDTPEKALFSKDIRAFSHGCIRLHRPIDMLGTFTQIDTKINFDKSKEILKENIKTPLRLSQSVPIDIIYISAWVDKDGVVQFRDDIYGYDELQMETAKWFPKFKSL